MAEEVGPQWAVVPELISNHQAALPVIPHLLWYQVVYDTFSFSCDMINSTGFGEAESLDSDSCYVTCWLCNLGAYMLTT